MSETPSEQEDPKKEIQIMNQIQVHQKRRPVQSIRQDQLVALVLTADAPSEGWKAGDIVVIDRALGVRPGNIVAVSDHRRETRVARTSTNRLPEGLLGRKNECSNAIRAD